MRDVRAKPLKLEIIVCSVEDAKAAADGGARRLEVVRDLAREGLTPSLDLVRAIVDQVAIPVRVMVRESEPFEVRGIDDIERLAALARRAQPEIAILPGAGVDEAALAAIAAREELHEAHIGRAARVPATPEGAVSVESVRRLARCAASL